MIERASAERPPALLVVGGAMRGGTTLLAGLLDSHPHVRLMARELRALRYTDLASWSHVAAVHQTSRPPLVRDGEARFRREVYRYLGSVLRSGDLGELVTIDRIHRGLVESLGEPGTRYVGDKYPDYVLLYPQFIHRPDTRCVFIHRDARDVVASIIDRIERGNWRDQAWARRYNTIEKATDYWLGIMQALHDVRRLESNALIVGYEDLVERTETIVGAMATHLGLPAEGFDTSAVRSSSLGRHRERLGPAQVDAIDRRAGAVMEAWGYGTSRA